MEPGSLSQWKPADVGDGKAPKGVAIVGVTEHIEITSSPYHIYHEQLLFGENITHVMNLRMVRIATCFLFSAF